MNPSENISAAAQKNPYVDCPRCSNRLGERLPDGRVLVRHRGRETVVEKGEVRCEGYRREAPCGTRVAIDVGVSSEGLRS